LATYLNILPYILRKIPQAYSIKNFHISSGTPSPRKKRNNSTPTKKNIAEKKQILQQLITPSANQQNPRKVSLGELIQLSERKMKEVDKAKEVGAEGEETETTFSTAMSDSQSAPSTVAMSSVDAKFEKKVTFARLLSKVSAEMSSGSEVMYCCQHLLS
jgi:hypothetical protein